MAGSIADWFGRGNPTRARPETWLDKRIYILYTYFCKMDVHFIYAGQRFCWDSDKAGSNLVKHSVRFEQACEIFFDPFIRLLDATPENEAREAALGLTEDWTLLFVVYLVREEETIRIISARPATREERRLYENE
jgi:hypothetical protein